jgi:hypothetical protein
MVSESEVHDLLDDVFEEEALVIGGLVATHQVEDAMIWRLCRSLDVIREKARKRVAGHVVDPDGAPATHRRGEPHPAIEQFLTQLGRG